MLVEPNLTLFYNNIIDHFIFLSLCSVLESKEKDNIIVKQKILDFVQSYLNKTFDYSNQIHISS